MHVESAACKLIAMHVVDLDGELLTPQEYEQHRRRLVPEESNVALSSEGSDPDVNYEVKTYRAWAASRIEYLLVEALLRSSVDQEIKPQLEGQQKTPGNEQGCAKLNNERGFVLLPIGRKRRVMWNHSHVLASLSSAMIRRQQYVAICSGEYGLLCSSHHEMVSMSSASTSAGTSPETFG